MTIMENNEKTIPLRSSSKKELLKLKKPIASSSFYQGSKVKPLLSEKVAQMLQLAALIIMLVSTVILFTLPIVFHYVSVNKDTTTNSIVVATNCSNSSKTLSRRLAAEPCSQHQLYEGSTCALYLGCTQRRLIGEESQVIRIASTSPMELDKVEEHMALLDSLLSHYPECQEAAVPFLCHYYYPLSDCSSGYIYSASREDCITTTTTVCSVPWTLAVSLGYGDQLPNCQELPPVYMYDIINTTSTNSTSIIDEMPITDSEASSDNITCLDDFMKVNSTCLPVCEKFHLYPPGVSDAVVYSEVVAGAVALIVAIIIIACATRNYKNMFNYYAIMVILMMIDYTLLAPMAIIMEVDRGGLLCSSSNLYDALNNPTTFCKISGAIFHYGMVNVTLWWFFHVSIFLYKILILCPFHAKRMESLRRQKYVLLVMILIGLLFPLPAVIISLSVEEHQYRIYRLPPSFCLPSADMWFYSATLVIDVLLCLGVCFLIIVFWAIHKHQSRRKSKKYALSTAEKKIMVVIGTFLAFSMVIMTQSGLTYSKDNVELLTEAYNTYFACESVGHTPGRCDRSSFEKYMHPYLSIAAYLFLGLLPISILNLVVNINWQSVKFCSKKLKIFQRHPSKHKSVFSAEPSPSTLSTSA